MSEIHYLVGDATNPAPELRPAIIAHIVNDLGRMGAGFALALAERYPAVKNQYRAWHQGLSPFKRRFELGMTQFVKVADDLQVANMLAQRGLRGPTNPVPLRLHALDNCLWLLGKAAEDNPGFSVVMPRIGTNLAGGRWADVEPLIKGNLVTRDIEVYVCDLH